MFMHFDVILLYIVAQGPLFRYTLWFRVRGSPCDTTVWSTPWRSPRCVSMTAAPSGWCARTPWGRPSARPPSSSYPRRIGGHVWSRPRNVSAVLSCSCVAPVCVVYPSRRCCFEAPWYPSWDGGVCSIVYWLVYWRLWSASAYSCCSLRTNTLCNLCVLTQTPRCEMYVSFVKPQDVKCMYP